MTDEHDVGEDLEGRILIAAAQCRQFETAAAEVKALMSGPGRKREKVAHEKRWVCLLAIAQRHGHDRDSLLDELLQEVEK